MIVAELRAALAHLPDGASVWIAYEETEEPAHFASFDGRVFRLCDNIDKRGAKEITLHDDRAATLEITLGNEDDGGDNAY